jgi:hypothetical protein
VIHRSPGFQRKEPECLNQYCLTSSEVLQTRQRAVEELHSLTTGLRSLTEERRSLTEERRNSKTELWVSRGPCPSYLPCRPFRALRPGANVIKLFLSSSTNSVACTTNITIRTD